MGDLPMKPKRCLQKEVFEEIQEMWEGAEASEDLMEVDEDSSEFEDDCEVEVSPFHGDLSGASPGWSSGSRGEERADD